MSTPGRATLYWKHPSGCATNALNQPKIESHPFIEAGRCCSSNVSLAGLRSPPQEKGSQKALKQRRLEVDSGFPRETGMDASYSTVGLVRSPSRNLYQRCLIRETRNCKLETRGSVLPIAMCPAKTRHTIDPARRRVRGRGRRTLPSGFAQGVIEAI